MKRKYVVRIYEIPYLLDGTRIETCRAPEADSPFRYGPHGITRWWNSTTGKIDGDSEFYPWHMIERTSVTRGRVAA